MSIDVLSLLTNYGIKYYDSGPNTQAGWVNIQCPNPYCGDKSNHGGFNLATGSYNCWKCGKQDLIDVIQWMLHLDKNSALKVYYEYKQDSEYSGRIYLNQKKRKASAKHVELPGGPLQKMHIVYLQKRGFDPDYLVEKYKILGEGITGIYNYRIIIPIIYNERVVSFTSRAITKEQTERYKNNPIERSIIAPKDMIYNLDNCRERWAVLLEGPTDVWRMGDNFCAPLGTSESMAQIRMLKSRFSILIIAYDPEDEAQKKAKVLGNSLASLGMRVILYRTGFSGDYGSMSEKRAARERNKIFSLL
jgi:DNA primase